MAYRFIISVTLASGESNVRTVDDMDSALRPWFGDANHCSDSVCFDDSGDTIGRADAVAMLTSPQSGRTVSFTTDDDDMITITAEALGDAPSAPAGYVSPPRPIIWHIANAYCALRSAQLSGSIENEERWQERLDSLCKDHLPSGSGFDNGSNFEMDESSTDKMVFSTSFHHMDDHGSYCGWTEHRVIVTPHFVFGFGIKITGRDKRNIKDYIADTFESALSQEITL